MYTRKFSIVKKFRSPEKRFNFGDDAYFAKHVCIRGNLAQGKNSDPLKKWQIIGDDAYFAKHV